MNTEDSVTATEIKNRFGDYLAKVVRKQEPLLIERHGKPVAVLVEYGQWETAVHGEKKKAQNAWIKAFEKLKKSPWQKRIKPFSASDLVNQRRDEESR